MYQYMKNICLSYTTFKNNLKYNKCLKNVNYIYIFNENKGCVIQRMYFRKFKNFYRSYIEKHCKICFLLYIFYIAKTDYSLCIKYKLSKYMLIGIDTNDSVPIYTYSFALVLDTNLKTLFWRNLVNQGNLLEIQTHLKLMNDESDRTILTWKFSKTEKLQHIHGTYPGP